VSLVQAQYNPPLLIQVNPVQPNLTQYKFIKYNLKIALLNAFTALVALIFIFFNDQ
jgi:hypothetical protein